MLRKKGKACSSIDNEWKHRKWTGNEPHEMGKPCHLMLMFELKVIQTKYLMGESIIFCIYSRIETATVIAYID